MEPFIGQIMMFGGNFAPRGWAKCEGQLLAISQNTALFSLLGTTYGGDGRTTFGLPDLRGRVPMSAGNGPGLTTRREGAKFGTEHNTMNLTQMPSHNHIATVTGNVSLQVSAEEGEERNPQDQYLAAVPAGGSNMYIDSPTAGANLAGVSNNLAVSLANNGGQQPMNNMQPALVVNFVIALVGIFPSRS